MLNSHTSFTHRKSYSSITFQILGKKLRNGAQQIQNWLHALLFVMFLATLVRFHIAWRKIFNRISLVSLKLNFGTVHSLNTQTHATYTFSTSSDISFNIMPPENKTSHLKHSGPLTPLF